MRILSFIFLLLVVYAVVMIVKSSAETLHKVLWALLVIVFPLVGLIIWALMGPGSPVKKAG